MAARYDRPPRERFEFDTEHLIMEVKKYGFLWDSRYKDHDNRPKRAQAWLAICYNIVDGWDDLTPEEQNDALRIVQTKWKSVKDTYRKYALNQKKSKTGTKKYIYDDVLAYLLPTVKRSLAEESNPDEPKKAKADTNESNKQPAYTVIGSNDQISLYKESSNSAFKQPDTNNANALQKPPIQTVQLPNLYMEPPPLTAIKSSNIPKHPVQFVNSSKPTSSSISTNNYPNFTSSLSTNNASILSSPKTTIPLNLPANHLQKPRTYTTSIPLASATHANAPKEIIAPSTSIELGSKKLNIETAEDKLFTMLAKAEEQEKKRFEDEDMLFLLSLLPTLKRMKCKTKMKARIEMMHVVSKHLAMQGRDDEPNPTPSDYDISHWVVHSDKTTVNEELMAAIKSEIYQDDDLEDDVIKSNIKTHSPVDSSAAWRHSRKKTSRNEEFSEAAILQQSQDGPSSSSAFEKSDLVDDCKGATSSQTPKTEMDIGVPEINFKNKNRTADKSQLVQIEIKANDSDSDQGDVELEDAIEQMLG